MLITISGKSTDSIVPYFSSFRTVLSFCQIVVFPPDVPGPQVIVRGFAGVMIQIKTMVGLCCVLSACLLCLAVAGISLGMEFGCIVDALVAYVGEDEISMRLSSTLWVCLS